jgi:hypothetical protein
MGPNLFDFAQEKSHLYSSSYLMRILGGMVEWYIAKGIIKQSELIKDLKSLVNKKALIPLAYKVEEYFPDRSERFLCLREVVLQNQAQTRDIYQFLNQYPFRGYIATTYDIYVEEAYLAKWRSKLTRFYKTSIESAITACYSKQPFILKLYGDIENQDSITLSRQAAKGLAIFEHLEQLQQLVSNLPVLFIGFEPADNDLRILKDLIGEREFSPVEIISTTGLDKKGHLALEVKSSPRQSKVRESQGDHLDSTQNRTGGRLSKEEKKQKQLSKQRSVIEIFLSFVNSDKKIKERLEVYLNVIKRQRLENQNQEITITDKDNIGAGRDWKMEVEQKLNEVDIILLLVSIDFLNSEFCTEVEMECAITRHHEGKARVIPIILDSCPWHREKFRNLKALPDDGRPVDEWRKKDKAYANIAEGIEKAIDELSSSLC